MSEARSLPCEAEYRRRYESLLDRVRNPARLVGNESGAGPGFDDPAAKVRLVLAFPDAYEIGISNQAIQILYHVARGIPGIAVERAYVPWIDVAREMRGEAVPLLSWETWTPVKNSHVLGITLQHELNYTNVLELLDLSCIPLRAEERGDDDPLVVAGGPAMANFAPMVPFFDVFAVGDGEELLPALLEFGKAAAAQGRGRKELKRRIARIPGFFVPGVSESVARVARKTLEGAPYPVDCLVPLTAGVHDRAWIEVMRGCTRGCRFCQAGMWYRPVRERPGEEVLAMAAAEIEITGHQELALGSLSTTDYSPLEATLMALAESHPEVHIALPSLRVDSAAVRLGHLTSPTSRSVTLAPEAATQRMRDVINKNADEDDILGAVREAFASGHTGLKLYFMIGLPTETDADAQAIVDLCTRLRVEGKRVLGSRANRLKLHVSVTNFIPKPLTPFQWEPMAEREVLERRQVMILRGLKRLGVQVDLHDIDSSYVEAALARGGVEMGDVIEGAWRRGARFDSWTEQERPDAWRAAFAEYGRSAEELATRGLKEAGPLPWDVLAGGVVTKEYLRGERKRARQVETTPDCRWEGCLECGACEDGRQPDLHPWNCSDRDAHRPMPATTASAGGYYVLRFAVEGNTRFLAHLDSLEALRRSIRRAGGRLALSEGMRPKPILSLALPRGVGVRSEEEFSEFRLALSPEPGFSERLRRSLPRGFVLLSLTAEERRPGLAGRVAAYSCRVEVQGADVSSLVAASALYTGLTEFEALREKPDEKRMIDVKAYVDTIEVETCQGAAGACGAAAAVISFRARVTPRGTVRPDEIVRALAGLASTPLTVCGITRTGIEFSPAVHRRGHS